MLFQKNATATYKTDSIASNSSRNGSHFDKRKTTLCAPT